MCRTGSSDSRKRGTHHHPQCREWRGVRFDSTRDRRIRALPRNCRLRAVLTVILFPPLKLNPTCAIMTRANRRPSDLLLTNSFPNPTQLELIPRSASTPPTMSVYSCRRKSCSAGSRRIRTRAARASSFLPLKASQRGDSMTKGKKARIVTPGMNWMRRGTRHCQCEVSLMFCERV